MEFYEATAQIEAHAFRPNLCMCVDCEKARLTIAVEETWDQEGPEAEALLNEWVSMTSGVSCRYTLSTIRGTELLCLDVYHGDNHAMTHFISDAELQLLFERWESLKAKRLENH